MRQCAGSDHLKGRGLFDAGRRGEHQCAQRLRGLIEPAALALHAVRTAVIGRRFTAAACTAMRAMFTERRGTFGHRAIGHCHVMRASIGLAVLHRARRRSSKRPAETGQVDREQHQQKASNEAHWII